MAYNNNGVFLTLLHIYADLSGGVSIHGHSGAQPDEGSFQHVLPQLPRQETRAW